MSRLAGKVAIVTGTSPNIGGGIAEGLADDGATVVCADADEANARQCADWISRRGGEAPAFVSGCGGFAPSVAPKAYERVAEALRRQGYIVLFVDYVGRRGVPNCFREPLIARGACDGTGA